MNIVKTVKLSDLTDDTFVSYEDAHYTLTAGELRERIAEGKESLEIGWYVASKQRWQPNAKRMLEVYIENEYDNGMYETWDERAWDSVKPYIKRIQAILDEAYTGDHATKYWILEDKIIAG